MLFYSECTPVDTFVFLYIKYLCCLTTYKILKETRTKQNPTDTSQPNKQKITTPLTTYFPIIVRYIVNQVSKLGVDMVCNEFLHSPKQFLQTHQTMSDFPDNPTWHCVQYNPRTLITSASRCSVLTLLEIFLS